MNNLFSMLPEWAPQQAVLLAWPHESTDWAPWLDAIQRDYIDLAVAISEEARPLILCRDAGHRDLVASLLQGRCVHSPKLVIAPYNDTWCRDYGPISLAEDGRLQLLDFQFHGWGDKYDSALDNQVNERLADLWQAPLRSLNLELEGGSIETDGCGSLLTTRHCLLNGNRNRGYSSADLEAMLLAQLGLDRILWLNEGMLIGDDTDSHIDNLARFCDPQTIAYARCTTPGDPHVEPLADMEAELRALTQPDGRPYRLQPIDLPAPQMDEQGARLPASYLNFLILNNAVLVPVFGCEEDAAALEALGQCFPGKRLRSVPGGNLIRQFGGPHCATMQLPVNSLKPLYLEG